MTIEQAMGIAKNAQQDVKELRVNLNTTHELAHEAKSLATQALIKHTEHEKLCADRFQVVLKNNEFITYAVKWVIALLVMSLGFLLGNILLKVM